VDQRAGWTGGHGRLADRKDEQDRKTGKAERKNPWKSGPLGPRQGSLRKRALAPVLRAASSPNPPPKEPTEDVNLENSKPIFSLGNSG